MIPAIRPLLLGAIVAALMTACSPSPTPPPTPTVTVEAAAKAYSAFSARWTGAYNDRLNSDSAAADADPANVARYAHTLADAYSAFADGVRAIEFPGSLRPIVQQELDAVDVLVALANQLERAPTDLSVRTQLQDAVGRVGERSATVDAALGLSH